MTIYLPEDQRYSWVQGFANKVAAGITDVREKKKKQKGYEALSQLGPEASMPEAMAEAAKYGIDPEEVMAMRRDSREGQRLGMDVETHGEKMKVYQREELEASLKNTDRDSLLKMIETLDLPPENKAILRSDVINGRGVSLGGLKGLEKASHFFETESHNPDGTYIKTLQPVDAYGQPIGKPLTRNLGIDREWLADVANKGAHTNYLNRSGRDSGGGSDGTRDWSATDQKTIDGYMGGVDALGQPLPADQVAMSLNTALAYATARGAPPAIIDDLRTRLKAYAPKGAPPAAPGGAPAQWKPRALTSGYDPKTKTLGVDNPNLFKLDRYAEDKGSGAMDPRTGSPKDMDDYNKWVSTTYAKWLKDNRIEGLVVRKGTRKRPKGKPISDTAGAVSR